MISGYCMLRHSGNNMIRKAYAGEGGYPPTQFFVEKTLRLVLGYTHHPEYTADKSQFLLPFGPF